jgi:hypothetical protein
MSNPKEWKMDEKIEEPLDEKTTDIRGSDYFNRTKEFRVGSGAYSFDVSQLGMFLGSTNFNSAPFRVNMKGEGTFESLTTNATNALTIDYGGNILFKEGGNIKFTSVVAPTACTAALAGGGAGNVDDGDHIYKITYVNASGETELGAVSNTITVVDKTSDGKVNLTGIPTSTSGSVTSRKIYRTKAGSSTEYYYLATINDNTTTTYTDNIADVTMTINGTNRQSATFGKIYIDDIVSGNFGNTSTFLGKYAGDATTYGWDNTGIGYNSLTAITTGNGNSSLGCNNLRYATVANNNCAIGCQSCEKLTSGAENNAIGYFTLNALLTGSNNTAIGSRALKNTTGSNNVALGSRAGSYETGSNAFYVDNQDRTDTAGDKAKAILYGVMAAAAANQDLTVNANLFISQVSSGSTQANAGAAANEIWKTNGHATLPDNVLLIGV